MRNKTVIIALTTLGIILVILLGVYFIKQNGVPENPVPENASENQGEIKNDAAAGDQKNAEQPQNKIITDEFSINLPAGWGQTTPAMGTAAMAVNANERINDPVAQKINCKSYFAVSYDVLQGKSLSEYSQTTKNQLQQMIPSTVFTKEQDITISGNSAHAVEAELTQQGADFKILIIVIVGQGEDVWIVSFNTTKSSWDGYKETFYGIADSFSLKK